MEKDIQYLVRFQEIDEAEQSFNAADAEPVLDITAEEEDVGKPPIIKLPLCTITHMSRDDTFHTFI